jgi:hypothetical protein
MSELETFEIDTELTRDAIYPGIWTRLCVELRGHEEGHRLSEYIERLAVGRGDAAPLLGYLDEDIKCLTEARRRLHVVQQAPFGSMVELDDVRRFMPKAWLEEPGRWIYTDREISETEASGDRVLTVRQFGSDERLRGQ